MGTIASVLQWTCTNCNLINPTECLRCLNCGNFRRILADVKEANSTVVEQNSSIRNGKHVRSNDAQSMSADEQWKQRNGTTKKLHQTPPGYVEIDSNG